MFLKRNGQKKPQKKPGLGEKRYMREKQEKEAEKGEINEHKGKLKRMSPISEILLSRTRDTDLRMPSGMGESLEF